MIDRERMREERRQRVSAEGARLVRQVLDFYVPGLIPGDPDYQQLEKQLLSIIVSERELAARAPVKRTTNGAKGK